MELTGIGPSRGGCFGGVKRTVKAHQQGSTFIFDLHLSTLSSID